MQVDSKEKKATQPETPRRDGRVNLILFVSSTSRRNKNLVAAVGFTIFTLISLASPPFH